MTRVQKAKKGNQQPVSSGRRRSFLANSAALLTGIGAAGLASGDSVGAATGARVPCVVLASMPRTSAALRQIQQDYRDFSPGTLRATPFRVELKDSESDDGGNGGGGEDIHPALGTLRKTFWDFGEYDRTSKSRDAKFPVNMRFELCLAFPDIEQARTFLSRHPAGIRVREAFALVEIVAISMPTYGGPGLMA